MLYKAFSTVPFPQFQGVETGSLIFRNTNNQVEVMLVEAKLYLLNMIPKQRNILLSSLLADDANDR